MATENGRLQHLLQGFFLSKSAQGLSRNTEIEYRKGFRHLEIWLDGRDPTRLTPSDIRAFLSYLRSQPNGYGSTLSSKTVYNAYVALRSFYRWLKEEEGGVNVMEEVKAPKVDQTEVLPLTKGECAAILSACTYAKAAATKTRASYTMRRHTAERDRAIVAVLLDSGLRASELCDLQLEDLDLQMGRLLVRRGKGGKGRVVYLGKLARRALWKWLGKRGNNPGPLFGLSVDGLRQLFDGLEDRSGVRNLHAHRLRHTFATEFLRNGGNLLGLQRLLGHSSLQMVKRYAAIAEADLQALHQTGSPMDAWKL